MPIAASLNLTSLAVPMLAPMLLGLGGNAITVSTALWSDMVVAGAAPSGDPGSTGKALAEVIEQRRVADAPLLHFGVVHPFSGHAYELRYWLAAAGIEPDRDVVITVLAPQVMADALKAGQLDGYCVGEPWNTAAVDAGTGRIATFKQAIWPDSPEKVLGVTRKWAEANPETLAGLMRAFSAAADWCAAAENSSALATILARPDMLACPAEICLAALSGKIRLGPNTEKSVPDFLTFSGGLKAAPMPAHGKWFYEQMVRWGQVERSEAALMQVEEIFSPDAYLSALGLSGVSMDAAIEMFDGGHF
jgi:NitT/TauT family transport system ATP-binding protein